MKKRRPPFYLVVLLVSLALASACDSEAPTARTPEILDVQTHHATIAWTSLSSGKGIVHYAVTGSEAAPLTAEEQFGESLAHEVVLRGLQPGKSYTYWLGDEQERYVFRTRPPSSSPFSFVFVSGDSQAAAAALASEVFDFVVCAVAPEAKANDSLESVRSRAPLFYVRGPDPKSRAPWFLDWGGLRLVFAAEGDDVAPLLQSAAPYAFGIIAPSGGTTTQEDDSRHQQLVAYNQQNPHRPVAFVIMAGAPLTASLRDGIRYLGVPSQGDGVLRVDVDVESIRAVALAGHREFTLREPPLGKQRTCSQCRRLADRGAYEESVAAYKEFISNNQGHFQVDDAIFSIAEIYDDKLFRFDEATRWYHRLLEEYPTGTLTPLARQRVDYLGTYNDFDFIPLQTFERIRKVDFSRKGGQESAQLDLLAEVEALARQYPTCRLAPVMRLWLANRYRQFSVEKAVAAFQRLRRQFPDAEEARDVSFEIGMTYYQAGRYSEAIEALERAVDESPQKKEVIKSQIVRSYRNIRRDMIAGASWALLAVLFLLALVAKPFGIRLAGIGKMILAFIVLSVVFMFAGYLIHEQFDSFSRMVQFAVLFASSAAIAAWISSATAAKFCDGVFWRSVVGSLLGLLFFSAAFYLIIYYLNVHYLILVTL